jgi:isoaspartyl peptidase/L-asparaginase-like protein (Ntn-hydrolase superfamily)
VAFDRNRRLASGTSTAGESGKLHGSVSATGTVIGCGIYVDQDSCISVSGCDDIIHKYAPALQISRRLRQLTCVLIDEATAVLKDLEKETGTCDMGAIVLTDKGIPLVSFRCAHFPWAYCEKGHVYYGCMKNEKFSEKIKRKEFM